MADDDTDPGLSDVVVGHFRAGRVRWCTGWLRPTALVVKLDAVSGPDRCARMCSSGVACLVLTGADRSQVLVEHVDETRARFSRPTHGATS